MEMEEWEEALKGENGIAKVAAGGNTRKTVWYRKCFMLIHTVFFMMPVTYHIPYTFVKATTVLRVSYHGKAKSFNDFCTQAIEWGA